MRKTSTQISVPRTQPPSIAKTLKDYQRSNSKIKHESKPVQQTEETVDRLNDIGKTYPFCVYYRPQVNDPL